MPSAYLKQVGGEVSGDDLAAARLKPKNSTGGTNLYSQNFSWGRSLFSLPGRSGLDASLGLSYNSLVWTKVGNTMVFDADYSNASPGFRLGFPEIEPIHYDSAKSVWAYMMVTPSGGRVQFRQTVVTNVYETADSSYAQLVVTGAQYPNDPIENITIRVTTTDGTQMSYSWIAGAYRCTEIKDRNGNKITVGYDAGGLLQSVTDTLGRVATIQYDNSTGLPSSIKQNWGGGVNGEGTPTEHTWATFEYTTKTVATNFGTLAIAGPPNGMDMTVLEKVSYADLSYTKFTYNGYIQVEKVENFAADNHVLNRVSTDLDSVSNEQADCPRFKLTRSYAENFNGGQNIVVHNEAPVSDGYSVGGLTGGAAKVVVHMDNHPHGLYSQLYFGESGWKEGLPVATEDCTGSWNSDCSTRKRWTWTDWDQDDPGLSYALNPRVEETRVGAGTSTKRTKIDYWLQQDSNASVYGLVMGTFLFDTDLSTIRKKTYTTYNMHAAYTSRRIIGLPSAHYVFGLHGQERVSKVSYEYDEGNFGDEALNQNISPTTGRDPAYGSSFVIGRGNLTTMKRWDVTSHENEDLAIESQIKYNTAGSPVAQITPWDGTNTRTTRIGYADNFNSYVAGRATYAYPTTITDPAGNSSTVKYRHDIGANVEANSPAPQGSNSGKTTKRIYDSVGRLERDSVDVNEAEYAYTRYIYEANGIQSKVYSTLVDTNMNNVGDTADEVLTESWTDGAGRVRYTRTEHPGSTGGWAAVRTQYDILGRVKSTSVPTEINPATPGNPTSWIPTGDDYRGMSGSDYVWLSTSQEYDWMSRVTRKVNTDGDATPQTDNASDIRISYEGCGCAGGQVITIEGELVPRTDMTGNARRKQKAYTDILGRTFRTETFDWNGNLYYSVEHKFNGRDQILESVETDESVAAPKPSQKTTASFDGHGRMTSSHKPQQRDSSDNLKYTTYAYNQDDSVASVTDGRGAVTSYSYENVNGVPKRPLVTGVSWTVPSGSGIADPADVTFAYDDAGNRTLMDDGPGSVEYEYDSLSRMTSELREFDDEIYGAPEDNNGYKLLYTYHVGGTLKSLKEPVGVTVNYGADKVGRLTTVAPSSSFGGVSTFASNAQYRAWGALKHLEYANGLVMDQTFDSKLQPATYSLATSSTTVMNKTYSHNSDGRLRHVDDAVNGRFDRLNTYDHQGRIYQGKSSEEANGGTTSNPFNDRPYLQTYAFDAFGNLKNRDNKLWHSGSNAAQDYTFTNNRITNAAPNAFLYDNDGRIVQTPYLETIAETKYDAAGRIDVHHTRPAPTEHEDKITRHYDGEGREAKRVTDRCRVILPEDPEDPCTWQGEQKSYYVRSTVLGGEVVFGDGRFVYAGGVKLAELTKRVEFNGGPTGTTYDAVNFHHTDAAGVSQRVTRNSPEALLGQPSYDSNYIDPRHGEFDAMGNNVGLVTNYSPQYLPADPNQIPIEGEHPMYINGQRVSAQLDGLSVSWQTIQTLADHGVIGVPGPGGSIIPVTGGPGGIRWTRLEITVPVGRDGNQLYQTGNATATFYMGGISWGPQTGRPAPLNAEENRNLDTRIKKLVDERLGKKDCRDFLVGKLGEDGYKKLIETLSDQGLRYSAERSTDITVEQAGIYGQNARQALTLLSDKRHNKNAASRQDAQIKLERLDLSVSQWRGRVSVHAVLGDINGKPVIFYDSFKKITTIVHENMHISTGLNDVDLANTLGLRDAKRNQFKEGDTFTASAAISQALIDKGCTN